MNVGRRSPPRTEAGKITFGSAVFAALLGALAYLGYVYVPVFAMKLEIRSEAKAIANRALVTEMRNSQLAEQFVKGVERRTGLELYTGQVRIMREPGGDAVEVVVDYEIPIEFPYLDHREIERVLLEVQSTRSRAY